MTIKELIDLLKMHPQDAVVFRWDGEYGEMDAEEVQAGLYDSSCKSKVKYCTKKHRHAKRFVTIC